MSIRLKIASIWLPDFVLNKELDNVARKTIEGLNNVLKQHALLKGNLEETRAIMAKTHNNQVNALIEELGYENAVKIGRKAMFKVGYELGQEARRKLGVGNSFKDLEIAARILYKILGIEFKIKDEDNNIIMVVNRCALSKYYSVEACIVLSAADEGVVRGLNENMDMKFKERITEGASECMACIRG
jgi:hypothetical protein